MWDFGLVVTVVGLYHYISEGIGWERRRIDLGEERRGGISFLVGEGCSWKRNDYRGSMRSFFLRTEEREGATCVSIHLCEIEK